MPGDTTTVQGTTDTTAASDVQAATSLLNTPIADEVATDKPSDDVKPDAADPAATEAKSDTDKPEGDESDDDKPQGAPEKYEFKAPEGVTLDAEAVAEFEPIAKEMNLSNDQAQKLVELQTKFVQKQHEAWDSTVAKWETDIRADKEIGGQALTENIKNAQRALTQFGTPELKSALDATRMGSHPELVRVFARIGKAMADDSFVSGNRPAGTQQTAADRLFGNSNKS